MRRIGSGGRVSLAAAVALAAATGCARFGKPPPAAPEAPESPAPAARMEVDGLTVSKLQSEQLAEQRQQASPVPYKAVNGFTQWLDRSHESLYRRMDNTVRWIDTKWLPEDMPYRYELSTFKLTIKSRVGGRESEEDFELKVRFRADMALPGLERRLRLFVDNMGRDELPGSDPMNQTDSDTRIGARAVLKSIENIQFDVGGGVRLRSSGPVAFGEVNWSGKTDWMGGVLRLHPRGYYYSNDGFGQQTELSWRRPTSGREILELRLVEKATEKTVSSTYLAKAPGR